MSYMQKETKKMIRNAGILVSAVAVTATVSHLVTKKLVEIAIDRKQPKISPKSSKKGSGTKYPVEFVERRKEASEELENEIMEDVEMMSDYDGERLVGHLWTCEKPKRTIIAMHGWRSSWSRDFGIVSKFWHENHCNVLFAEQRAHGNSGGDYIGFGMLERFDCVDWVRWVNENQKEQDVLPIYLSGISMGAATVLMAAGLELPENVCGIIADCGYTSVHDIWKHVAQNNLHISYGIRADAANELCKRKIHIGAKEYSCIEAMKNCKVPVLFIHGTDDHFVPVTMSYENYKACVGPKRLFVVPGADHLMSYWLDTEGYESVVKKFWEDYDIFSKHNAKKEEIGYNTTD